ncbi:MAG: DUF4157 domain-containing protein [Pseudomonadota bacterium]
MINRQTSQTHIPVSVTPVWRSLMQRKCVCGNSTMAGEECEECSKKKLQRKLSISASNDPLEQEADRVADQVLAAPARSAVSGATLSIQRFTGKATSGVGIPPASVDRVLSGSGRPLDTAIQQDMGNRFGYDFSNVRVHTGSAAEQSARDVNALAYTVGHNIVFGGGRFDTGSNEGRRLFAHELTHVVQQSNEDGNRFGQRNEKHGLSPIPFPAITGGTVRVARRSSDAGRIEAGTADALTRVDAGTIYTGADDGGRGNPGTVAQGTSDAGATVAGATDAGTSHHPKETIVRQGGDAKSFVSTDAISFTAEIEGLPDAGALSSQTAWSVHGVSADSGNGNPSVATNRSNFSFTPNPTNRPTTGSRTPNDPIKYRVEAQVAGSSATYDLEQDESDIIRQEYIDLGPVVSPRRSDISIPSIPTFNTGNYSCIVDRGMNTALTNTRAQFQSLTQQAAAPDAGVPAAAPVPIAAITVESGYRNPRRNVAVGSPFPVGSRHVWGSALDLGVAGANATLWDRLRTAGQNAGNTSICEVGPTQVLCNNANVNHVHIQW